MENAMKTLKQIMMLCVLVTVPTMVACNQQPTNAGNRMLDVDGYGNSGMNAVACSSAVSILPIESISDNERNGLLYMREEEKLAHDVYVAMYSKWNAKIFSNISRSEQTHTDAVLMLLQRYNIPDPVGTNTVGVFTNTTLQTVYNDVIQKGNVSLAEAIKVGLLIEELDMRDLQKQIAKTDNQDIKLIYDNLMRASQNHVRAFNQNATILGVTYVPLYITQQEYNLIVNSDWEHGTNGNGECRRNK